LSVCVWKMHWRLLGVVIVGPLTFMGSRGRDRIVVEFTTRAISAYHQLSREFKSCAGWGVLDTTLCDKVCQGLAPRSWFSSVSSTNKTDRHDITEMLLKVALNTITLILFWTFMMLQNQQLCHLLSLIWNESYQFLYDKTISNTTFYINLSCAFYQSSDIKRCL